MSSTFENPAEDRKKKILDACLEEFAGKGYEKASTNVIVKKAGVSKGILFHYFGSKKNLYLYVFDFITAFLLDKFHSMNLNRRGDIFEKLIEQSIIKFKLAKDYPLMHKILFDAFINTPDALKNDMSERYNKIRSENIPFFIKDIDTSGFRSDIDHGMAMELILLVMNAVSDKYLSMYRNRSPDEAFADMDRITDEFYEYLDILKFGIYEKHNAAARNKDR